MKYRFPLIVGHCLLGLLLTACQTAPEAPAAPGADAAAQQPAAQEPAKQDPVAVKEQALARALDVYADGRYDDAIASLSSLAGAPELPLASQVKALKFIAFSHCAMGRLRQCRQHFDLALEQDPTFQLTEAEKGHPVWGREFNAARAAAARAKRGNRKTP
ncbi:TssQ family T6SS-associated lipoprotein [Acidovorax sp. NCPPB 3576]|uniref:TssQ family T6SS-associated lipoprotein n=1 Tax=Acidovorax sp. NCPPB 3576 TaxID=2940488 RepID=UPI002349ED8B|nr:TssQ family T6SS-associated lipoprotein [Acidovorax sp. NCPPB 3576]WCM90124.1 TssQ family T6SS-associated lipoprotein [Acidovorax sp. NCPPB 3576]